MTQTSAMIEPTLAWARAADESDPLREFREQFHIPPSAHKDGSRSIYLAGNSLGCMPRGVDGAIAQELEDWKQLGVDAHLDGANPWYTYHEALREPGAFF